MKANRAAFDSGRSNWVSGYHAGHTFKAKVFTEPSMFGIPTPKFPDGGNISKLHIVDADDREVYAYDRGLDYSDERSEDVTHEIIAALEAEFCEVA